MQTIIENSNKYGNATGRELDIFEAFVDGNFPKEYKDFLLEHNGGYPVPNYFNIPSIKDSSIVDCLYHLHSRDSTNCLTRKYKVFRDRMPPEIIPIGSDPGGNQICMAITGKHYGTIYFWDHECEADEEKPSYSNVHIVASRFSEFLSSLEKSEE